MSAKPLKPMSPQDLLSTIQTYLSDGMDSQQSTLTNQVSKSIKYYYGEKLGNEVKGKSAVVSKDVADAVDWLMPSLMRVFAGDKSVVSFIPNKEADVKIAKQAEEYVNYLYNVQNEGFINTYSVIQDALLAKNGIMKHYYKESIELEFDSFTGLSKEDVEVILLEENAQLSAMSDPDPMGLYDVEISRETVTKKLVVEAVPPEEFIIDTWSAALEDSSFHGHRRNVTRSELVALGFDKDLVQSMSASTQSGLNNGNGSSITRARNEYDNAQFVTGHQSIENSQESVQVLEGIILVDFDGDGIAERRRVVVADDKLLVNERYDEPLFTDFRSHIVAHKFYGLSMYDQLKDIQKIKTTLLRNILDNMYTLNNGRFEVIDGQVNMDDLLNNTLGGVVRTKMAGAIKQLDTPALPMHNFTMLDYLDTLKDNRTGLSKTTRGMNDNVLHSNQAASSVADVMSAAEQKQELIARILGHSFAKLFSNIYKLTLLHVDSEEVFQVRGEYVTVNPSNWRKDYIVRPIAGIGNDRTAEKVMNAQMMMNLANSFKASGGENVIYDWDSIYEMTMEVTENAGFLNPYKFWRDPSRPEGKAAQEEFKQRSQQPSPTDQLAMAEVEKIKGELQIDAQKIQADAQKSQGELEIRLREVAVKERQLDIKEQELEIAMYEAELKHASVIGELALEQQQGRAVTIGDGQAPNLTDGDLPSFS